MPTRVQWLVLLFITMATGTCLGQEAPFCDMDKISELTYDWDRFNGSWFLKMQSTESTFIRPDAASQIDVTVIRDQGGLLEHILWQENLIRPGSAQCEHLNGTFGVVAPIVQHHQDRNLLFGFVAIDYESVLAVWLQHGIHTALNIYSRTPTGLPALNRIQQRVTEVCGEAAGNAFSGVYNRFLCYENLPACFSEGLKD